MKISDPNRIVVKLDGRPLEGAEVSNAVRALALAAQLLSRCELSYEGDVVSIDDIEPGSLAHTLSFLTADPIRTAAALASTRVSRARHAKVA